MQEMIEKMNKKWRVLGQTPLFKANQTSRLPAAGEFFQNLDEFQV